jgi:alanyl-tRNA synthetase
MQYNRINNKTFTQLPSLVVDTGMGLERLSAVLNNLTSNYDTDLFVPLFNKIHSYSNEKFTRYNESNEEIQAAYRILADHMRSISVSISDGLLPSRNGLGGFLKYLILKCLKISNETFRLNDTQATQLLCDLVPIVVDSLKQSHPDLSSKVDYIQQVINVTNKKQIQKLTESNEIAQRYLNKLNNPNKLTGEQIWKLFKGDGSGSEISIDFINEFCRKKEISLDIEGFDRIFLVNNEKALKNMKNIRKDNTVFIELSSKLKQLFVQPTQTAHKYDFELDTNKNESFYKSSKL